MGNRANFAFVDNKGDAIVLYGHWAGSDMLKNLADAVGHARSRWNDSAYATRIVTSRLIGDQWNMETGWGLTVNEILDNEHKIPVIDWNQQTFSLHEEADFRDEGNKVRGMKNEAIFTMDLSTFVEKYSDHLLPV